MEKSDYLFLIKNKKKTKHRLFLIILLTLVFIILFLLSMVYNFYTKNVNDALNNNIDYRRYIVDNYPDKLEMDSLNKISNIEAIYNAKYLGEYYVANVPIFKNNNLDGSVYLAPLITTKDITTTKNTNIKNIEHYAVCPEKFYPTSGTYFDSINVFNILKGEKFIGQKFSTNGIDFSVVDTYNSDRYYVSKNICYISFEDYKYLIDNLNREDNDVVVLQLDSIKNIDSVTKQLKEKGYNYSAVSKINYNEIDPIIKTTSTLVIVVLIITLLISFMIIKKKIKSEISHYELLKTLGYKEKNIITLSTLEILNYCFKSLIYSLIIFLVMFLIIKYFIFTSLFSESNGFNIPYTAILILSICLFIYLIIINYIELKKSITN